MNLQPFNINLKKKFDHLPSAPIVEAVIHWRARSEKSLQDVLDQLKTKLPDYPNHKTQHKLEFQSQVSSEGIAQEQKTHWHGFRFESKDNLQIAQFNRDGFVFSRLAPYKNWDQFSKEALRLWKIHVEFTELSEVQRLGVRFINRIPLLTLDDLSQYLEVPPTCPASFQLPFHNFTYQNRLNVPGHPYNLNVIQTVQPPTPPQTDGFGLILDIDVFTTGSMDRDEKKLNHCLEQMRWLKNKAFFTFLLPEAIERFKEKKS